MDRVWIDILSGSVSGVVAAALIALFVWGWRRREDRIIQDLILLMGTAIEHRNSGKHLEFTDEARWVAQAKSIERQAVARAYRRGPSAGALVDWLDRVDPYPRGSEREKYISILSKTIERIRGVLEHHR